jgi:hypothetical protein
MTGGADSVIFKDGTVCRSLLDRELLNTNQVAAGHVAVPPNSLLSGWFVRDTRRSVDWYWWEGLSKSSEHSASKPKFERGGARQGTAKSSCSVLRCENAPKMNCRSNHTCIYRM